jgi:hypothetical protein
MRTITFPSLEGRDKGRVKFLLLSHKPIKALRSHGGFAPRRGERENQTSQQITMIKQILCCNHLLNQLHLL